MMLYAYDAQWYRGIEKNNYTAIDKGHYVGSCNRSDCQAPRCAFWWNQSTHAYYCFECAGLINEGVSLSELVQLGYDITGLCVTESSQKHPHHNTLEGRIHDVYNHYRRELKHAIRTQDTSVGREVFTRVFTESGLGEYANLECLRYFPKDHRLSQKIEIVENSHDTPEDVRTLAEARAILGDDNLLNYTERTFQKVLRRLVGELQKPNRITVPNQYSLLPITDPLSMCVGNGQLRSILRLYRKESLSSHKRKRVLRSFYTVLRPVFPDLIRNIP